MHRYSFFILSNSSLLNNEECGMWGFPDGADVLLQQNKTKDATEMPFNFKMSTNNAPAKWKKKKSVCGITLRSVFVFLLLNLITIHTQAYEHSQRGV